MSGSLVLAGAAFVIVTMTALLKLKEWHLFVIAVFSIALAGCSVELNNPHKSTFAASRSTVAADGSPAAPFQIATLSQLQNISTIASQKYSFIQTADIDMTGTGC